MMEINLFKIPSSSRVLLLSAIFSLTSALPHSGPDPTASYAPADWNPRPTSVPRPLSELLKRTDSNASICGWVGGNVNEPSACPSDSKCVYDTSHGMVGCCPLSGSCTTGVYTSCVGSAQGPLNPSILTCSGGSVCYENTFPGGYYQYACGASTDAKTIETVYSGQNWATQLQIIYTQLTLATTQSPSSTILSTSTTTQSPSSSSTSPSTSPSALSSKAASTLQTTTSASSQTPTSTGLSGGAQSAINTSVAATAAAGPSPQAQAGIIAGSVVGGVGVVFAILALGCSLLRRRRRQKAEERSRTMSFPTKEKSMSISSYASSQISQHARIHPFSPEDIISPMTPPEQAATTTVQPLVLEESQQEAQPLVEPEDPHVRRVQLVDTPVVKPLVEKEQPYIRRVQLVDRPSIDDLADLPPPWVRPPTPPPRSPKRLTMKVYPPEDQTPLEVYLKSAITPIRPSASVTSNTSDTSRYSRTTDGRSIKSIKEDRNGTYREGEAPPMPIMRKPVGSGWYRTMAPVAEKKPSGEHVAFQLSNNTDRGRSLTTPQQTRERSISVPARASATEDVLDHYANMSATIYNVQELDYEGLESDWVAPLRLSSSVSQVTPPVKKQRNSEVPILGVPAAPPPGGRGSRLYDVQR